MKIKIKLFLMLTYIFGILLAGFNILLYKNYVNPESLLVTASPIVTSFTVCCAVAVVFIFVLPCFTVKKVMLAKETDNNSFMIFCSSLLGFLFAGYTVSSLFSLIKNSATCAALNISAGASFDGMLRIIYYLGVFLAIPSAVYFIVLALQPKIRADAKLCLLSVAPVLWCAVRLIYVFMQTSARVNIAGRKISIVALCLCVIFFLCESKLCAPKEDSVKNRREAAGVLKLYIASGCGAIVSLWISQIATTLLQAFWILPLYESYILNSIFITITLYITSRISSADFEALE